MRTRTTRPGWLLAVAVLGLLASISACSWAVPAHPGLNTRQRSRPAPARSIAQGDPGSDDRARSLYYEHCSRCHAAFDPSHVSADRWPLYVGRYGPRAGLFGEDRDRVTRWLQAHAGH